MSNNGSSAEPELRLHHRCHGIIESRGDPQLRRIHNETGMVTPDGMPLVFMARRLGFKPVSRVYGRTCASRDQGFQTEGLPLSRLRGRARTCRPARGNIESPPSHSSSRRHHDAAIPAAYAGRRRSSGCAHQCGCAGHCMGGIEHAETGVLDGIAYRSAEWGGAGGSRRGI